MIAVFLIGLAAGTIGSIVGLGGGFLIVPMLLILGAADVLTGITPQVAAGTSSFAMIFTALASTLTYLKNKTVDISSAWIFLIGTVPGSILGVMANSRVNSDDFYLYLGIWMFFVSGILFLRGRMKPLQPKNNRFSRHRSFTDFEGNQFNYSYDIITVLLISVVIGFSAGFFGIGGGSLMVPAMLILFNFPPHIAVGTSMFVICLSSIASATGHIMLGNVNWVYAAMLIPGGFIGGKIGSHINTKIKGNTVVVILRFVLIFIGIKMLIMSL